MKNIQFFSTIIFLLSSAGGASAAEAQPEQVRTPAGGDAILPCRLSSSSSDDLQTLEWSKKDLDPDVVFLYRDGCETPEMKNEDFEFRTSLFLKELNDGNASLRISNLKASDAGTYRCRKILTDNSREETLVELHVGPVSPLVDLKLAVVSAGTEGVTVECQARCWSPELEMKLLDGEGNDFSEEPREELESGECVTMKQRVTLQDPTTRYQDGRHRVVCRLYQPLMNQSITAEILISGSGMSFISIMVLTNLSTVTICLVPVLVILLIRKGSCKSGKRKLSDQSAASEISAMLPGQSHQTTENENEQNHLIDSLHEEVALLRSQNDAKDELNKQLKNQTSSPLGGVISQLNQPTISPSPYKSSLESSETPNPTPDFNSERRKLLSEAVKASKKTDPKPDKPSKKTDPEPDKPSKKTDPKPNKLSKKTDPKPNKPSKKTDTKPNKPSKENDPKADKDKKINPNFNKAKNSNHQLPVASSPAQLTLAPPELIPPVWNKKKDPVVHICSQSDPVHQFDPNPVYQRRSLSEPVSSSSYYNRFSPLAED